MLKRLCLSILIVLALASPAFAIVTYNVDYLTGGNARALDYISVNDLNNGDRAIGVSRSGVSDYYLYFKYDASGTTAEQTAAHPYYIRPNDYTTSGVWCEIPPGWADLGTSLSLTNLTISGTFTANNVDATGRLSGGIVFNGVTATTTASGVTLYGGYYSGVSRPTRTYYGDGSGVTLIIPAAAGDGETFMAFNKDSTYTSGNTLYLHFTSGDTVNCNQTITAGTSKFIISGTAAWANRVLGIATGVNEWTVLTVGTPTVDWD